jgi:predicted Zn-dependent protease
MRTTRISLLLLTMFFLTACQVNPSTGRRQLMLFSGDEVAAMGEEAKTSVIQEYGGEVESQALRDYVKRIGADLVEHVEPEYAHLNWEFFTLDTDVANAFALPGGKIFITRGLMENFDNEAQVAGVLGHEIGHVTAKHIDERLSKSVIAEGLLEILRNSTEQELYITGAALLTNGVMLKFSRDDEYEADSQGVKYMTAAGYNPKAMSEVLEVLMGLSAEGGRPPEFLSTHPYPESRVEAIAKLIGEKYEPQAFEGDRNMYPGRFQREAMPHLR